MPHKAGHKYILRETGEEYRGRTVKRGNQLFTTTDGGYEGDFSRELIEEGVNNNMVMEDDKQTPTTDNDIVTQFIVGEKRGNTFYHPTYSNQKYYYLNGNTVSNGTQLHHHTIPPNGRSNFMTQHTMGGNTKDVTPIRRKRRTRRNASAADRIINQRRRIVDRNLGEATLNRNGMTRTNNRNMTTNIRDFSGNRDRISRTIEQTPRAGASATNRRTRTTQRTTSQPTMRRGGGGY